MCKKDDLAVVSKDARDQQGKEEVGARKAGTDTEIQRSEHNDR
jgi:hypothetical protein